MKKEQEDIITKDNGLVKEGFLTRLLIVITPIILIILVANLAKYLPARSECLDEVRFVPATSTTSKGFRNQLTSQSIAEHWSYYNSDAKFKTKKDAMKDCIRDLKNRERT